MKLPPPKTKVRGAAFTLIELLTTIGIVCLLAAMIMPVFNGMIESGKRTRCLSNLRQIGLGISSFTSENNGMLPYLFDPSRPGEEFWYDAVCKSLSLPAGSWYTDQRGLFFCPSATTKAPNYTMSWSVADRKIMSVTNISGRVIVADGDGASGAGINQSAPFGGLEARRHKTGANYLFVDGHAEFARQVPTNGLTPLN